jgi:hypothetical protein
VVADAADALSDAADASLEDEPPEDVPPEVELLKEVPSSSAVS